MGKKTKKPGKGKEKTERKTAKAEEKRARRDGKKLSPEDDIDAILVTLTTFFPIRSPPPRYSIMLTELLIFNHNLPSTWQANNNTSDNNSNLLSIIWSFVDDDAFPWTCSKLT